MTLKRTYNQKSVKAQLLIVVLVSLLSLVNLYSQKLLVHKYTEEDGLPSSMIYSIAQDKDGSMFFATRNGLARYDGRKWYSNWDNLLPSKSVRGVLFNENDKTWLLSPGSPISLYQYKNKKWQLELSISPEIQVDFLYDYIPFAIISSETLSYLSIIPKKHFIYYHNGNWQTIDLPVDNIRVFDIISFNNTFYVATDKGLFEMKRDDNKLKKIDISLPKEYIKKLAIEMNDSGDYVLWIFGDVFIGKYDFKNYSTFLESEQLDISRYEDNLSVVTDYYNTIIIASLYNILQIEKDTKRIISLGVNNGLIDNTARTLFLDKENILWFGSDRGISKVPSMRFISYNTSIGLLEDEVASIVHIGDRYYVGHNDGVTIFRSRDDIKHLVFPLERKGSRAIDMTISPNEDVYIAGAEQGLLKIDKNDRFVNIPVAGITKRVQSVEFDNDGTLYVIAEGDIYYRVARSAEFKLLKSEFFWFRKLFVSPENSIYATTISDGLWILKNGEEVHIKNKDTNNILNKTVAVSFKLKDTILVGTEGGLGFISGNSIERYTGYGLNITRPIYFIQYFDNAFWFGTDAGVIRWDKTSTRHYGIDEGIAGLETNRDAGYIDKRGFFWIGTNKGASRYNPKYDNLDAKGPICRIVGLTINNIDYDFSNKIEVSASSSNFVFHTEIISFYHEHKNSFRYKLEGFDSQWSEVQLVSGDDILYRRLPPGKYRLHLQAANSLGVWSDIVVSEEIIVKEPFYSSSWFYLIVIIILIAIIYFILNYLSEKRYKKKLVKQVIERTSQLAESELRYKQMFIDNNAYMLLFDAENGSVVDANPSALAYYGLNKENIANLSIFDLLAVQIDNKSDYIEQVFNKDTEQTKHIAENGIIRDVVLHQSIIKASGKSLVYAIVEDVTARLEAEKKLKDLNQELEKMVADRTKDLESTLDELRAEISIRKKTEIELFNTNEKLFHSLEKEKELGDLKSRFISMISHEYRTPLTVILSSAYLVKESIKRELFDEIDRHLFKIHSSVTFMSGLLEDVLTFGKTQDGTLTVQATMLDINLFFNELIEEVNKLSQNSHIINFESNSDISAFSDRYLLRQIFINIMLNSVKYSEKQSSIFVSIKQDDTNFIVSIRDEGKGIKDEDLEHIFDPFYRNVKEIGIIPGSGLGLSIVKRCISMLNGDINVNNKLDKGVVFIVTIPLKHSQMEK